MMVAVTILRYGALILLVSFAIATSSAGQPLDLSLRLQPGDVFQVEMQVEQNTRQTIEGSVEVTELAMRVGISVAVHKVLADASAEIEMTYTSIYFKMSGTFGEMVFDSTDPASRAGDLGPSMEGLIGRSFGIVMTSKGEIVDVRGLEALVPDQAQSMNMGEILRAIAPAYPARSVRIGDSWSSTSVLSAWLPCRLMSTWSLVSRENGIVVLDVVTQAEPNRGGEPLEIGGYSLLYRLSGSQRGTARVDEATGWPLRTEIFQAFSGEVEVESITQGSGRVSWPVSIRSTVTMSSTKQLGPTPVDECVCRFTAPNRSVNVGSSVRAICPETLRMDRWSEVTIYIEGWNETETRAFGIIDVYFHDGLILLAVPDDRVVVDYDGVALEYEKDGTWFPFESKEMPEPGPIAETIWFIVGFIPGLSEAKVLIDGVNLLDELARNSPDLSGPGNPAFADLNQYDIVEVAWSDPIVPGLPFATSIVTDIGNRNDPRGRINPRVIEKLRFTIPVMAQGRSVGHDEIFVYTLYSERVSLATEYGYDHTPIGPTYRECEIIPCTR
jgi:hypothetical protein